MYLIMYYSISRFGDNGADFTAGVLGVRKKVGKWTPAKISDRRSKFPRAKFHYTTTSQG